MTINNNQIKAIIFDMDGVLIDTEKYLTKFWCKAAREAGFNMELSHAYMIRSLQGKFAAVKLKEIFGETFDYKAIRNRRKELMNEHLKAHGIEPKPYVKEALTSLKASGYVLAVATSTDSIRAKEYLTEIGVYSLFDKIVCANMVENGKPMPDIYLYACKNIGYKPESCIAVEDSANGVTAAYRAGLNVIMIPDLTRETEEEKAMTCKVVTNLNELADLLTRNSIKKAGKIDKGLR